jgi:hypothetical protein
MSKSNNKEYRSQEPGVRIKGKTVENWNIGIME